MGTTMHAHIEVKVDGKWEHFACPCVTRNYLVFACINGMRRDDFEDDPTIYNKIRPVSRIHKIPEDISEITRKCLKFDESQYTLKGHGVLESDDLMRLQEMLRDIKGIRDLDYDLEYGVFHTYINGNAIYTHYGFDDARIVYWFDN